MRLDDYRESENVEQGGGGGGGFGGGGMGLLLGLVGSRFGLGGIVVVIIGMFLFGMNPLSLIGGGTQTSHTNQTAKQVCEADASHKFSCQVLASTEDTWARLLPAQGAQYAPTTLHFYNGQDQSGCGAAQSAMGPFYCPTDKRVYLDTSFFQELQTKFQAAGDFAQAYVIAHEVGHHVQNLLGIADKVRAGQQQSNEAGANALQVRMELQADCYAGVWATNAKGSDGQSIMQPGDAEEGLRAAGAIGDDTLQKSAGRTPVPDSFTHGTSAERVAWLKRGLTTGDPAKCDTFTANIDGI
jgi:predicted metalloprotease